MAAATLGLMLMARAAGAQDPPGEPPGEVTPPPVADPPAAPPPVEPPPAETRGEPPPAAPPRSEAPPPSPPEDHEPLARRRAEPPEEPEEPQAPLPFYEDLRAKGARPPYFPVNFSFLYPLSTNAGTPDLWTHFDFAILVGRVGFVDGLQLGVVGWTVHDLRGVQLGVASVVGGAGTGIQVGAGFSFADGPFSGMQVSGIFGWASHHVQGMQIGGVANQTYGNLDGLQASAGFNLARRQVTGVQAAGVVNIGKVEGLQIGAINVSQEMTGLQVGVINIARNFKGLQIGVINITDNLDGESLGIAPLPRRGGIHAMAWASNSLYGNLGVKFASRYAYSILSGALHSVERDDTEDKTRQIVYAAGLTLGATIPLPLDEFALSADFGGYRLFRDTAAFSGHDEIYKLRVMVSYPIAPRLKPFIGGGANLALRGDDEVDSAVFGGEFCVGLEL